MQHDEVIWQVIRHNHCSFMAKIETGNFCRNPYNVTGICNRSSCPLANSRYCTIRDHDGVFYLYMKTIERAHMPNDLWERIKLPRNYEKALELIDSNLLYWPKLLVHKTKQRLTKMTQMRIRMRKLALKTREKIMTMPRRDIKREARREKKAETAALLEKNIEKELLERLKSGVYDNIYNYPQEQFESILEKEQAASGILETEEEEEEEPVKEYVEFDYQEEDEDDMEDFGFTPINPSSMDDDEDSEDDDEEMPEVDHSRKKKESGLASRKLGKDAKSKKKSRVVEVEREDDDERQTFVH
ncbi:hypothetical protein ACFE04_022203 [Oxalis oulophora]